MSKPNCFLFHNLVSCLVYDVQPSYRSTRTKSTIRLQIRHHYRIMPHLGNKGFHNSNLLHQQVYTCFIFNKAKKLINTIMTNIKTEPHLVLPPDKHASLQSAENFAFCLFVQSSELRSVYCLEMCFALFVSFSTSINTWQKVAFRTLSSIISGQRRAHTGRATSKTGQCGCASAYKRQTGRNESQGGR